MGSRLGSPNKNKERLWKVLRAEYGDDFDPIMKMAEIATNDENEPALRLQGWKEIAQYVYPKLKAVEVTQGMDEDGETKAWTINIIAKEIT